MPRKRNSKLSGRYSVGDHKGYQTAGAAASYAQNLAKNAEDGSTFYVRDITGNVIYRIERTDGIVYTFTVGG